MRSYEKGRKTRFSREVETTVKFLRREIFKEKGAMYKVATPRVFLQRNEQVEAAWLRCRLMQRSGRERLDDEGAWAVRCSRIGGVRILGLK